jgi:hypothetical protein
MEALRRQETQRAKRCMKKVESWSGICMAINEPMNLQGYMIHDTSAEISCRKVRQKQVLESLLLPTVCAHIG